MGWVTYGWGMRGRRIYKVNSTNFARNEGAKERRASGRTKEEEQRARPRFANSNFRVSSASRETVIILAGMSRLITIARTYGPA